MENIFLALIAATPPTLLALATLWKVIASGRRQDAMHRENLAKLGTVEKLMRDHVKDTKRRRGRRKGRR